MMINKLLAQNNEVSFYKIVTLKQESAQLFFALDKLETIRKVKSTEQTVTVYNKHENFLGEATFHVFASDNTKSLKDKINNAVNNAKLINNPYYELVKDEKLTKTMNTNIKKYDLLELGKLIRDVVIDEVNKTDSKINALEIFVNKDEEQIENNLGLKKKVTSYNIFVEAIPTYDKGEDSFELYQAIDLSSFDEKNLREQIAKFLSDVKNRAYATTPNFKIDVPVLLNKQELAQLFGSYSYLLNYGALYNHQTILNEGADIQENSIGDKITLSAVKEIKSSSESRLFDNEGSTLIDTLLIENGIVKNFYGNQKFGYYLNKKVTGNLPCIKVEKGTMNEKEAMEKPHLNCLSFSGIQVDPFTDYLGGEVRLAEYFDGKETKYLTGFSINGKLSEVLKEIKLSNKTSVIENYEGPNMAMIKMNVL